MKYNFVYYTHYISYKKLISYLNLKGPLIESGATHVKKALTL